LPKLVPTLYFEQKRHFFAKFLVTVFKNRSHVGRHVCPVLKQIFVMTSTKNCQLFCDRSHEVESSLKLRTLSHSTWLLKTIAYLHIHKYHAKMNWRKHRYICTNKRCTYNPIWIVIFRKQQNFLCMYRTHVDLHIHIDLEQQALRTDFILCRSTQLHQFYKVCN
jgi:hypothetical protein